MKKKKKKFNKKMILPLISIIVSTIFAIMLLIINILPIKYFIFVLCIIILFNFVFMILNKKSKKRKIKIFNIIYILLYLFGIYYLYITYDTLNSFQADKKIQTYYVVALKDNDYKIEDLNNLTIGFYKDDNINKVKNKLETIISFKEKEYKDDSIFKSLKDKDVSAIVVEQAYYEAITSDTDTSSYDIIYKFNLKSKLKNIVKETDVTKNPFVVYISGIDTYGTIENVSRSDVNILIFINPKTKEVLIVNTPRDYYVLLGNTNSYDKLTHAGIDGVESSIKTLENLYDVDINYYFKVNFSSVESIVDVLGGIDVTSEYSFTTYDGYYIKKGINHLNGKEALSFARTRKAFTAGDRVRGMNQMQVIKGLINKMTSSTILTKYTSLLNSVNGKFQTNFSSSNMSKLVNMQLNDMSKWNINSISVTGEGSYEYGYYYPNQKLYVMLQDEQEINKVKKDIDELVNGKSLGDISEIVNSDVIDTKEPTVVEQVETVKVLTSEDNYNKKESNEEKKSNQEELDEDEIDEEEIELYDIEENNEETP